MKRLFSLIAVLSVFILSLLVFILITINSKAEMMKTSLVLTSPTNYESQTDETFEKTGIINKTYKLEGKKSSNYNMMIVGSMTIPITWTDYTEERYYVLLEGMELTADQQVWEQLQLSEGEVVTVEFNQNLHITKII
ncbi:MULTISPECIES: hypothetical protein [unclassified Paenibacillus]|uniref:DUF5412 domain-containing protein n=1 Tax=Paenibacillus provencensis TaxID=441151 RepID=A0ABW3PVI6_9BACL|nr:MULTISPECIES: hypothetical protein [unclassified Paenibacillus]MCM3130624.1 hypothetical protein [Paenibacillus sp. MER 78]SDX74192.1 hypothetical protein SAMN05518848_11345 [Paenibacillus sp. PDC88]SFS89672.1 hypothetical protein SAMN04488601_106165 [Paenibacillus sp. 453mf]